MRCYAKAVAVDVSKRPGISPPQRVFDAALKAGADNQFTIESSDRTALGDGSEASGKSVHFFDHSLRTTQTLRTGSLFAIRLK